MQLFPWKKNTAGLLCWDAAEAFQGLNCLLDLEVRGRERSFQGKEKKKIFFSHTKKFVSTGWMSLASPWIIRVTERWHHIYEKVHKASTHSKTRQYFYCVYPLWQHSWLVAGHNSNQQILIIQIRFLNSHVECIRVISAAVPSFRRLSSCHSKTTLSGFSFCVLQHCHTC